MNGGSGGTSRIFVRKALKDKCGNFICYDFLWSRVQSWWRLSASQSSCGDTAQPALPLSTTPKGTAMGKGSQVRELPYGRRQIKGGGGVFKLVDLSTKK